MPIASFASSRNICEEMEGDLAFLGISRASRIVPDKSDTSFQHQDRQIPSCR
jgi:hypothetical protein